MPDTPSLTLVKRFVYRDLPEEWSNTYHFDGPTPSDDAGWKTLMLQYHGVEKTCYFDSSVLVKGYGYAAGSEHAVAAIDFTTGTPLLPPGTLVMGGAQHKSPGDAAGWIRAKIGMSSTGKSVYIRKYFHDVARDTGDPDEMGTTWKTNALAAATALVAGTGLGGTKWCGPQGQVASLPSAARYITTRTLKRRGKRPTTGP